MTSCDVTSGLSVTVSSGVIGGWREREGSCQVIRPFKEDGFILWEHCMAFKYLSAFGDIRISNAMGILPGVNYKSTFCNDFEI
ncbi:hypothetical protein CEXT_11801 [Caerostris extrusa]|uniref:Uncharacterized protein n=1 Tax=Caerostris extrusa TaxID=172846 RepID=A0AAV4YEI8_CAEEX|nr:hypothetical protein CEXT_11801 [Caerostris extrusa]